MTVCWVSPHVIKVAKGADKGRVAPKDGAVQKDKELQRGKIVQKGTDVIKKGASRKSHLPPRTK